MNHPTDQTKQTEELKRTAYHEAGHAYASWRFEIPVRQVTCVRIGEVLGLTRSGSRADPSLLSDSPSRGTCRRWEEEVVVLFAGSAAEKHFGFSDHQRGAEADLDAIGNLLRRLYGEKKATLSLAFAFYESWANDVVTGPNAKPCISLLADELMRRKKMNKEEILRTFARALEEERLSLQKGNIAAQVQWDHACPTLRASISEL